MLAFHNKIIISLMLMAITVALMSTYHIIADVTKSIYYNKLSSWVLVWGYFLLVFLTFLTTCRKFVISNLSTSGRTDDLLLI